jgi:O-antigen ligase
MGRKRKVSAAESLPAAAVDKPAAAPAAALPREVGDGGAAPVAVLALLMLLAPALGVPHEEMLQDTLKSMLVAFAALLAALLLVWSQRRRAEPMRWHDSLWLPIALMAYALGSMAWSHTYLAGVEAVRWFLFALLAWVALNTLSLSRLPRLAVGIHTGAVAAALWAALQFWVDLALFPQGPGPASTFVNRNFFAEFAVCTLPFGFWLWARAGRSAMVALLALSNGFVIVAILMTGTRAALIALAVQLVLVFPLVAWRYRTQLACASWRPGLRLLAAGALFATVAGLGAIPTGNPRIAGEGMGMTALERAFKRGQAIRADDESLGLRMQMWKATLAMVGDRPLAGVGAGAWESEIPRYQAEGAQLETDYYAHNEYLQLASEYGLLGWLVLLLLAAWLLRCAWRTWLERGPEGAARAVLLAALLAFCIVSSIGFPWRLAVTGALFALCLGALAASDVRLAVAGAGGGRALPWSARRAQAALAALAVASAMALYISQQAARAEELIVGAARRAKTIADSPNPRDPRWAPGKREVLEMIREGIAIHPHYRKITPIVADEMSRWGDWHNAIWIWDSVLQSRPYVVAILGNVAKGHVITGQPEKAWPYLERAKRLQPRAAAIRAIELAMLIHSNRQREALALGRQLMAQGVVDAEVLRAVLFVAQRHGDGQAVAEVMQWQARLAARRQTSSSSK